jgi:hypothetical protein
MFFPRRQQVWQCGTARPDTLYFSGYRPGMAMDLREIGVELEEWCRSRDLIWGQFSTVNTGADFTCFSSESQRLEY